MLTLRGPGRVVKKARGMGSEVPSSFSPPWPRAGGRGPGQVHLSQAAAALRIPPGRREGCPEEHNNKKGKRSRTLWPEPWTESLLAEANRRRSFTQAPASGTFPSEVPLRPLAAIAYTTLPRDSCWICWIWAWELSLLNDFSSVESTSTPPVPL